MGQAQGLGPGGEGGYGDPGDPDGGGGPSDPYNIRPTLNTGSSGSEGSGGSFLSNIIGGTPTPFSEGTEEVGVPSRNRGGLSPDTASSTKLYGTSGDDDLLKTLVFNEDEFTKNLF